MLLALSPSLYWAGRGLLALTYVGRAAWGWAWDPPGGLGIGYPLVGTLVVAGATTLLLLPAAVAAGVAAASLPAGRGRAAVFWLLRVGERFPPVLAGTLGVGILLPLLRGPRCSGYGILATVLTLTAFLLPGASRAAAGILGACPEGVTQGGLALGLDAFQVTAGLALRTARRDLAALGLSAWGTAVADGTVASLVTGNQGAVPPGLCTPTTTLSSVLLTELSHAPWPSPWAQALTVQVLVVLGLCLLAHGVSRRLTRAPW